MQVPPLPFMGPMFIFRGIIEGTGRVRTVGRPARPLELAIFGRNLNNRHITP